MKLVSYAKLINLKIKGNKLLSSGKRWFGLFNINKEFEVITEELK